MSNSRLERFIYAICGMEVDDLPTPLSRIETLWNCLISGETPDFEPLSRNEKYLMSMIGQYDILNLPEPTSRSEKLLYKIATGETDLTDVPGYLSRYEELLKYLIENGGIGGTDFEYVLYTLNDSFSTLYSTAEAPVKSAILKGKTGYRDKDTGEILETFEEGRNLELVSVTMPVLKTFNNIVDFSNDKLEFEYGVYFGQKGDGTDQVNNKGVPSSFVYTLNYINVLGNRDKMRFYGNDTIIDRVVWFDENKNQIGLSLGYNNRTVAIPTGTKYFRFLLNDSRFIEDKELAKKNIGHYNFYYGDENKSFSNEPYKSNILSTPEDLVMRSNGNVYDELDLITGKFIQRIDESNEVLAQEVVKTVVLSTLDQDGQPTKLSTFNDITHVSIEAEDLLPTIDLEVATKIEETLSSLPTQMIDISETQQSLNEKIDEQAENIKEVSAAMTEIRNDIL